VADWSRSPACGNVTPLGSIAVGGGVAVVCYVALTFLKPAFGYDDSLDAFGVHGVGGTWGALASGIFASTLGAGIESNGAQILVQLKGMGFVAVFAPVMTVIILSALKLVFGSRGRPSRVDTWPLQHSKRPTPRQVAA
jgi:Amt family ammonium transporter